MAENPIVAYDRRSGSDGSLAVLGRLSGIGGLAGRALLAGLFINEGQGKIRDYADVLAYMHDFGIDGRLLPLVILTELGGGLLILTGLATRWAALALAGFCILTAALFHANLADADQFIHLQKNLAIAGGFITLAVHGPGSLSLDAWLRISFYRRLAAIPNQSRATGGLDCRNLGLDPGASRDETQF
eukprot:gene24896-26853_t